MVSPWLVRHPAWLLNRYAAHDDRKTSYERRWSTRFNSGRCTFGECVHYKLQTAARFGPRKLNPPWSHGLWLGTDSFSNEAPLSIDDGVVTKSRSIRRLPPSQHYRTPLLLALRFAPWDMDEYLVVRQMQLEGLKLGPQRLDVDADHMLPRLHE